ncbi:MAG: MATE family efflux transporter [Clostridium sp.]|nr:MATE family efflux transporter [Clostridium sp.]
MKDKTTEIFQNASVPRAVLFNVIPSIVSMIMVLIYNLADTFFIGQTNNAYMVAAVSLATPVFLLFMAVGMLFGIGGTSLISRMLGQGERKKAKNTSSFCFWSGLVIGAVSMVLIWIFVDSVCSAVGASADTMEYTRQYLAIVACGIPFLIVSNSFSNIIRAEGNAQKAMIGMIVGNLVNIILDPVFILACGWDVKGAAVATVIGNVCSSGFYLAHLLSKKSILSIKLKDYRVRGRIAIGVFSIGIPASLNNILMSVSNIVINNMMTKHGDMAVAGLGVAMKVNMIVVMLLIGLGTGVQPLLGYCFGAKNKQRYMAVLRFSLALAFCLSLVMTVACYCGAGPLVRAFLEDEQAYTYGLAFARIYIYSGPILGLLFVFVNAIQSTGAAVPALILSVSRQGILFLPILLTMNAVFNTPETLAIAQPVTDYLSTVVAAVLFYVTYRKYIKQFQK